MGMAVVVEGSIAVAVLDPPRCPDSLTQADGSGMRARKGGTDDFCTVLYCPSYSTVYVVVSTLPGRGFAVLNDTHACAQICTLCCSVHPMLG